MNIKINIYNFIVCLILILSFVSEVLPNFGTSLDIAIVLIMLVGYITKTRQTGIKGSDIAILFLTLFLIVATQEISRISLLFFYIILGFSGHFKRSTIKTCLITSIVCFCIIIFLYFAFGFNTKYDTYIWRSYIHQNLYRRACGFTHPNQCMFQLFCIVIFLCLYTDKIKIYLLTYAGCLLFYFLTLSRTGFFCVSCLFLVSIVGRMIHAKKLKVFLIKVTPYLFIILTLISILSSFLFANTSIDDIFTGRLALNKMYMIEGFSLWGNLVLENVTFDNSFIHMLLTKGILYFIVYTFIITTFLKKHRLNYKNSVLLIFILVFGYCEVILLKYNIMLAIALITVTNKEELCDTENNSLLLVRKRGQTQVGQQMY